jgi:surface antigen
MSDARDSGSAALPGAWRVPAAIVVAAGLVGSGLLAVGTARASAGRPSTVICAGWASCDARGDSSHRYGAAAGTSWWRMFPGDNCTNYAAYVESTVFGAPAPSYLLGNAGQWAASAAAHGVPVNNTPSVGAVAEWDGGAPGMGAAGHVAVVEQVSADGRSIAISQQAIGSDPDGYDWTRISAGFPASQWQEWPDHFIHFAGTGAGTAATAAVGYYDAKDGSYRLEGALGQGAPASTVHRAGPGAIPLAGDWTGRGTDSIGWYDPRTARFRLRDQVTGGPPARSFRFGPPGMVPLAGDWDGRGGAGIGYYDPATGWFYLRNDLSAGPPSASFRFGPPHMIPLAGDWAGSGRAGVGYYDPATGRFSLRRALSSGPAWRSFRFGPPGMMPLAGAWSGPAPAGRAGRPDGVGFYNPSDGWFHLRAALSGGPATDVFKFGPGGMIPLAGRWG